MHTNEFSKIIDIKKLHSEPKEYLFNLSKEEMEKLSKRFGFILLEGVESSINLNKSGSRVFLEGRVQGEFQVDSFFPVKHFDEEIKVLIFTDKMAKDFDETRLEENINDPWDCELMEEETIDVGEIIAQYISLATMDLSGSDQDQVIEIF